MKERPILFNGEMVRAVRDGRKTQTRRVIKPSWSRCLDLDDEDDRESARVQCPYGEPGDLLWVREAHRLAKINASVPTAEFWTVQFREGFGVLPYNPEQPARAYAEGIGMRSRGWKMGATGNAYGPWRPSIHMPRWASRLTLRVTEVRVERVQDISEDDARAEGVTTRTMAGAPMVIDGPGDSRKTGEIVATTARYAFGCLWNSINEARGFGWSANPWVWVVTFEVAR